MAARWTVTARLNKRNRTRFGVATHGWKFLILDNPDDGAMYRVATVEGPSNADSFGKCEAHAFLIAAAPDAIDACRAVLAYFEQYMPHEHGQPALGKAWAAVEAAIRKSEGRP